MYTKGVYYHGYRDRYWPLTIRGRYDNAIIIAEPLRVYQPFRVGKLHEWSTSESLVRTEF